MINLNATTDSLEMVHGGGGANVEWDVSYIDYSSSDGVPGAASGSNAGNVTLLAAPGAGVLRQVRWMSFRNISTTASVVIHIDKDISAVNRRLTPDLPLLPGEALQYTSNRGFVVYDAYGREKSPAATPPATLSKSIQMEKIGATAEAIGIRHCLALAAGFPGAWAPGTPGLNGRATDGMASADFGCLPLWTPSLSLYLMSTAATATVACFFQWFDVLWVNSGLVVTTTTAQAIGAPVALPARDQNGSTNGEGVNFGILVSVATTNAGAVTNMTMSYTNSDGTAGRTATMASFPATAAIGTFVAFQLQGADKGVRSVQSVTLGTSLVAGTIHLVGFTVADSVPVTLANAGQIQIKPSRSGNRLYNGACLLPFYIPTATTALNLFTQTEVEER